MSSSPWAGTRECRARIAVATLCGGSTRWGFHYGWLRVPVLDQDGEIIHDGGISQVSGRYVLGLQFLRRRGSSFLDGVGKDAAELANHIAARDARARRCRVNATLKE
ncbi:MAG TPA: hypothetical protein VM580_21705 [Labilithrix sp.]|nr:hypothetical protein [Labilithrix sp.]